jgi:hypothetical protein
LGETCSLTWKGGGARQTTLTASDDLLRQLGGGPNSLRSLNVPEFFTANTERRVGVKPRLDRSTFGGIDPKRCLRKDRVSLKCNVAKLANSPFNF